MIRILFLLAISCLLACGNEEGSTSNNGNTTTKKTNSSVPHPSTGKTKADKDALVKKKMESYADDVFVHRAIRSAEMYCKCKTQKTPDDVAQCQKLAMKTHETRMQKFPESKAEVYNKTYQEEIKRCK